MADETPGLEFGPYRLDFRARVLWRGGDVALIDGLIVNGHVPVRAIEGESPINTPLTMKPELVIRSSVARI